MKPDPVLDYRPLAAVMQQLPQSARWTKAHRDRWLRAFEASLDFLIEVIEEAPDAP